ncbi:hypothetical protein [Flavobacterium sp. GP15]|uniref:hypothetical protein n=1 Tax=Flavobacterium sp. GP15 TaxID=2758567 RepID=UPI00165EB06F|nr:hypothetical protein [Flavobacterium sp. GP15]
MTTLKKIVLVIVSLITIIVLLNFGLNFWIDRQLPQIISENNPTPYAFTYSDLKVDLLSKNIKASHLTISPKSKSQDSLKKIGIYAKIESIEIIDFKIWDLVFSKRIKANSIKINSPEAFLYKNTENAINDSKNIGSEVVKPFEEIIVVSKMELNKGSVTFIYTKTKKPILSLKNLNLQIDGIVITDDILKQKIPFQYKTYELTADSIYYRVSNVYHLRANNFKATTENITLKKFELIPEYSRSEFVKKLDKEKDLFTLRSESIAVNAMDWGFKDDKLFFNANSVKIDQLAANIYRNKLPADDLSKKPLYSKLLRDLKFPLKLDTLAIRNSVLVYEEELNFQKGPGVLKFNNFNLTATHIQSGYGQKKLKNVNIDIDCKFMKNSPFKVNWTFNVLDKQDRFIMHGEVSNLNTNDLYQFTKPYINATTQGIFDKLKFTIKGNDINSYENASLQYHDLKVTLYKKGKPEQKNKIKSALANLILKNDSKGEEIQTKATVERVQEKSFFNFLWINIAAVLKQILI